MGSDKPVKEVLKTPGEKQGRILTGPRAKLITAIAIAFSLFQIWATGLAVVPEIYRNAVHLGFLLVLGFLLYPAGKRSPRDRFSVLDIILALLGMSVALYILLFYNELHQARASIAISRDYLFAALAVILVIEAARRVLGPVIPLLSAIFLVYAVYGRYFPGIFAHGGFSWERVLYRMYLTYEGLFGVTITVSSTYIFLFILFGAFLKASGAAELFNDLALAIAGRKRGGPAQVAVLSSAMMGTLSGSAVANVATTGSFTIPMMKRIGYKPYFAGAVEAAASTGGMMMPPIMGAASFLMASFLGLSYVKIMLAAVIPALLYYAGIFITVDLEARRLGLKGLEEESLPRVKDVLLKRGILLLPVIVVVYFLLAGKTPLYAGFAGIISTILASWVRPETRIGFREALKALEEGAKGAVTVGVATAVCGIIVGVAAMTGVGSVLAYNITNIAHGSIFFTLVFTMATAIVLSMGLPSTALYIVVAVVAAPALVKAGVVPLAAHFFVFWFGVLSNVTPPVALAAYTAAGIAGDDPLKTGWTALKLTIAGFIVPFIFVYSPNLLLIDARFLPTLLAVVTALVGVFCLGVAVENYFLRRLFLVERILVFAAALLLIKPGMFTDGLGLALAVGGLGYHLLTRRKGEGFSRPV